jgi:leader peptidase (prepilin peptidase)/N-methyltransferase
MALNTYADFARVFPWFFPVGIFCFGAIVGSFLNVCIYRIPVGKSVVRPGSQCACGQPVKWYDNIPIFSWILLRGHARCCGRHFSVRYPLIEALTGGLFLACWLLFPPGKAACGMVFSSALICATFIDLDTFEIPDIFSVGLGVVGLFLSIAFPSLHDQQHEIFVVAAVRSGAIALQGMFIGAGLVVWIAVIAYSLLKKDAMGFGDVKLVGAIGAFCGWQGTFASLFGGAILGTLWFIGASIWGKITGQKIQMKSPEAGEGPVELGMGAHVPFGPMLAIAGLLDFLVFHRWVAAYFAKLSSLL